MVELGTRDPTQLSILGNLVEAFSGLRVVHRMISSRPHPAACSTIMRSRAGIPMVTPLRPRTLNW